MQKRKLLILGSFILLLCKFSFAQDSSEGIQTWLEEEDGSPSIIVYKEKVSNGTLTDNSDGTASLNTSGSGSVSDTAYAASWDGVTTIAPSKNAIYDKIETLGGWTRAAPYIYPTTITDNVGIGFTAPLGWLQVGTSPSAPILFVGKNGNIGVGKTAPSQVLDVSGTIAGTTITGANVTSGADPGHTHGSGSITEVDPNAILTNGTRGLSGNWYNANYQIATLGNVGVGNTAPVYALDVTGDIRATGDIISADQYTITGNIGASGNLGAGTTAPIYRLDVQGSGNVILNMTGNVGIGTTLPFGLLQVGTSPNVPLIVLKTGNVGIGTTNPSQALDVIGTLEADTITEGGNAVYNSTEVPGGELGGSFASFTVDSTHSGSAHHSAVTLGAGNDSSLALSGQELTLTVAKDLVTTAPLTGGTDNILTGADADITIALTQLKDIVTTAPLTGGENDVLPGGDADLTLAITIAKDIVAGVGLSGGEDNVLPGADADTTLTFDATELSALTWSGGGSSQFSWDWNLSAGDPKINFNDNSINIETGNLGVGLTAPIGRLQVGTTPSVPLLIIQDAGNVGVGTSSPSRKLEVAGLIKSTDTKPMTWLLINLDQGVTYPEFPLSITETMVVDKVEGRTSSGSLSFELRLVDSTGTTPIATLTAGTLTNALLTLTPGKTVPSNNLVVLDIHTSAPRGRLTIFKRQN